MVAAITVKNETWTDRVPAEDPCPCPTKATVSMIANIVTSRARILTGSPQVETGSRPL